MGNTKGKATESKNVTFDGNDYSYYDYITVNGDSIREYSPANGTVKPGKIYTVKHVSSPDGTQRLLAREESGQPLAGKEVRISPTSEWGQTLTQAFPRWAGQFQPSEDRSKLSPVQKVLYKIFGYQQGGWLNKFADGGTTPTQQPSQEQVMRELMSIVQQAATELQSNKPGQGVQTLAQIVNDPQGAELLNMLAQQVPEIEQVIEAVSQMAGSYKCGGKAKKKVKKVKKGAKGCIPCKKLMRIGGTLTNVMVDCEGNIISRYQAGGRFIPKAEKGLTAEQLAMLDTSHDLNWAKSQAASVTTKTAKTGTHYYLGNDGKTLYSATADNSGIDGQYRWKATKINDDITKMSKEERKSYGIVQNGSNYTVGNTWDAQGKLVTTDASSLGNLASLGNAYTETTTAAGPIQYYDGTGWFNLDSVQDASGNHYWQKGQAAKLDDFGDDDMKTGIKLDDFKTNRITAEQAKSAGIDTSKFENTIGTRGNYTATWNSLTGEKPDETEVTQGYMDSFGSSLAAARHERRQRLKDRWDQRKDNLAYNSLARLTRKDKDATNDVQNMTKEERQAGLNDIDTNYANQASRMIAAIKKKRMGYNVGTPASNTTSTSGTKQTGHRDVLKQGGWLTKFN